MRVCALTYFNDKQPGDVFDTNLSHGLDLIADGLAERAEPAAPAAAAAKPADRKESRR